MLAASCTELAGSGSKVQDHVSFNDMLDTTGERGRPPGWREFSSFPLLPLCLPALRKQEGPLFLPACSSARLTLQAPAGSFDSLFLWNLSFRDFRLRGRFLSPVLPPARPTVSATAEGNESFLFWILFSFPGFLRGGRRVKERGQPRSHPRYAPRGRVVLSLPPSGFPLFEAPTRVTSALSDRFEGIILILFCFCSSSSEALLLW